MKMLALLAAMVALPFAAGAATTTAKPFGVVSVSLPGDLRFDYKKGPNSELVSAACLTCHSSAYVSTQPRLDREHWVAEIAKMRKAYGAQIADPDAEKIADYLTAVYGTAAR